MKIEHDFYQRKKWTAYNGHIHYLEMYFESDAASMFQLTLINNRMQANCSVYSLDNMIAVYVCVYISIDDHMRAFHC